MMPQQLQGFVIAAQAHRQRDEAGFVLGHQFGQAGMLKQACRHATGKRFAGKGKYWAAGPERIGCSGVRVVGEGVEKQVDVFVLSEVFRMRELGHEDQPFGGDTGLHGVLAQALIGIFRAAQQPQHAVGRLIQNAEKTIERLRVDFVAGVEAGEHCASCRQAAFLPRRCLWNFPTGVVGLKTARQANHLFADSGAQTIRLYNGIGQHIVHPGRAGCSGIAQPVDLYWCRTQRKQLGVGAAGENSQVDQQFDSIGMDALG